MQFLSPKPPSSPTTPKQETSSAAHPTTVSATTTIPSKHQAGTRLPTSPAVLQNLLAPFNSVPRTPSANMTDLQNTRPNQTLHSHSLWPPSPQDTRSLSSETAGPGSATTEANHLQPDLVAQIPGTSRVGVDVGQRVDPQISVRNAWQFVPFFTKQATNIASSFVSHHLYGPPKKSWGIEMTIFTSIMRDIANYTHLSSINQLRKIVDFGRILPSPKDGIITPVSFKVQRHNLTGFLKEFDQAEDGKRVLTGEWVVSKKTWRRLQTESLARRSKAQDHHHDYGFTSPLADKHGIGQDKVIYYIHGGAYYIMSAATHRPLTISIAKYTECRLFAVNYRLAPETKFPGPLHDVVVGYFRLLNDLNIPAQNIVFAGDSAGGGMVLALLMYLRDEGYPLPSAAMLYSPWCDLTMSCDSWETNQPYDFLPMPKQDDPLNPVKCYLGEEGIKKYITHPYVSPLFGDLHGLPPLLIQAGDAEVLRDEITLLAHKASLHGVKVSHEIYEDCVHVFQVFLFLESSTKALQSMRSYIRHVLPKMESEASLVPARHRPMLTRTRSTEPVGANLDERPNEPTDPSQGAVDREISSEAHLVNERSQTVSQALPPTPAVPNLDGVGDEESNSDSEETLSAPDDIEDEDEHGSLDTPTPNMHQLPSVTHMTPDPVVGPSDSSQLARNTGLSLRGRLPPAMDIEALKSLILSDPSGALNRTGHHTASGSSSDIKSNSSRHLSSKSQPDGLGSVRVVPTQTERSPKKANGQDSPKSPWRRHSASTTPLPSRTPLRKYMTSHVALLTPMVRAQQGDNSDLKAMVAELITTPSELRTTVYRQNDDLGADAEYFLGFPADQAEGGDGGREVKRDEDGSLGFAEQEARSEIQAMADFAFQTPGYGFL